jgi:hypothetical protein
VAVAILIAGVEFVVAVRRIRDIGWPIGKTFFLAGLIPYVLVLILMLIPSRAHGVHRLLNSRRANAAPD